MTIETLTAGARALLAEARGFAGEAESVAHDTSKVAMHIYMAATHAEASRWSPTLDAMLTATEDTVDRAVDIQTRAEELLAGLASVAAASDPDAAEARILLGTAENVAEVAADRCVEQGDIAEMAKTRVEQFAEFHRLALDVRWQLSSADIEAADAGIARLTSLAFDLATISTEEELDGVLRRRSMLDHPSNRKRTNP